jgi:hypothetical protein
MRLPRSPLDVALVASFCAAMTGCTSQQLYTAGQQWKANECRRLPPSEIERCMKSNAMSYEEYQREAAAAKAAK